MLHFQCSVIVFSPLPSHTSSQVTLRLPLPFIQLTSWETGSLRPQNSQGRGLLAKWTHYHHWPPWRSVAQLCFSPSPVGADSPGYFSMPPKLQCGWLRTGKAMAGGNQCFLRHLNPASLGFISEAWNHRKDAKVRGLEVGSLELKSTCDQSWLSCCLSASWSFSFFVYKMRIILTQLITKEWLYFWTVMC